MDEFCVSGLRAEQACLWMSSARTAPRTTVRWVRNTERITARVLCWRSQCAIPVSASVHGKQICVLAARMYQRVKPAQLTKRQLLTALCAFVSLLWVLSLARFGMPPIINDVATDLNNPPQFVDNSQLGPLPQSYTKQIFDCQQYKEQLRPLQVQAPVSEVFQACVKSCSRMPRWTLKTQDSTRGIIDGVAVTALLRFKDDFVIRLAEQGGSTRVDMSAPAPTCVVAEHSKQCCCRAIEVQSESPRWVANACALHKVHSHSPGHIAHNLRTSHQLAMAFAGVQRVGWARATSAPMQSASTHFCKT